MSFQRLVRFISTDDKIHFGEAILSNGLTDSRLIESAYKITGDIFGSYEITSEELPVKKLLSPLSSVQIPTVRMIGMNYRKHAIEINLPIPQYPCLFYKPSSTINNPADPIVIPKVAQIEDAKVDYEAELVVVIGKSGKDIKEEDALDHVLGYTVGNDVSQRTWQIQRGGSQFSTGKMFDTWAPIGPAIVSPSLIPDPNSLNISSKINGEVRQNSNTEDAIFSVRHLISFLSQGTTLQPGDLIFTGTPQGVGSGFKPEPKWLKDTDVAEIEIENIGTIQNFVKFD
ncbi:hypothetical protein WICPIJ_009838 [Wickerhamomyces pijperi]|uniref:Fumarylacetoacetase-like C-terminal domain-containing protein n=1 Tax=Wickerhamomyces pijperi TaxID=599730 RepID=A0A9P8TCM3_WICPI|nr:hypothetical protein WICPIJ_009838 [Wickerhamomyces pijperi]